MRNCEILVLKPESYTHSDRVDVEDLEFELKVISRRLAAIIGEDVDKVRKLLALSACVHDVGKALNTYQEILAEKCLSRRSASLSGHEIVSSIVAVPVVARILSRDIRRSSIFIAGILLHHVARRSIDEAVEKLVSVVPRVRDEILQSLNDMFTLMSRSCSTLKMLADVDMLEKARYELAWALKYHPQPITGLLSSVVNTITSKYGELVAYIISIVDNIDSYLCRRDEAVRGLLVKKFLKS